MAKLKPRARLIRTIGDKLISGPEAAIIELVKNAYDADSPYVNITFSPPIHEKNSDITSPIVKDGFITITDQGHGMTLHDLENIWLEPATDEKTKITHSKSGNRTVLGAKGVGRFATASLGKSIELTTVAEKDNKLYKYQLSLDWDIFESAKYLEEIDIDILNLPVEQSDVAGVSITVIGLKNIWGKDRLTKLIQELRRLATPKEQDPAPFKIELNLKNYQISAAKKEYEEIWKSAKNKKDIPTKTFSPYDFDGLNLLKENNKNLDTLTSEKNEDEVSKINLNPYSLGDHCHYKVKGIFNSNGDFTGTFQITRGDGIEQPLQLSAPKLKEAESNCGELDLTFRIFDLESTSVKSLLHEMGLNSNSFTLNEAREFISESTGVGIFRNDFRIRPYGHHAHDWLKLEKRRVQNPSRHIGHNQLSGEIHVQDEHTSMLVERSSREGLEENGAFNRLQSLLTNLLLHVEVERQKFREHAGISRKPKKDFTKALYLASFEKVTKAIDSVHSLSPEDKQIIQFEVNKTSTEMEKVLKGMNEYLQLLESRATLGHVVTEILHEGRGYLNSMAGAKDFFIEYGTEIGTDSILAEIVRNEMPDKIQNLSDSHHGLTSLFKKIDPISGRRRGKPSHFNILKIVKRVDQLTKTTRFDSDVFMKYDIDESLSFFGFEGDFQAALMNLVFNATHWLSTIEKEEKYISISVAPCDEWLQIFVQNNGPEINEIHYDSLFEAGFTLKSNGHGLGLSIAREAAINSGGNLFFEHNMPLTTFKINLLQQEKV